ncbi:TPA: hypothetical protein DD690_02725 [Candidatus Daviesbacteria bacterium]|nr:MAG: hypothetical protein A3D02_02595 [Candidatus Daviesbacteria bacterium RIFCSPHIGHO2_02_FULL_39_41]OGE44454.1 MAG: hypothetical protein A3E67_04425 [Candidatus Daviesbacteria bacterium RIFCSPHIGHO2_12_FULL_38_25]OGE68199.1 MAG: hypothetical protein A3H81_02745 [Candidatus Daviesbacteria bacterium RIFCSPLOWO2_02_FULL_38_18]OGE73268.1 MAG: hypothetical protein A3H18_05465 [Candidatus Daviesbacteria bacterium RIFCSPLOWO2_12_FULL_38_10]HBQ50872.1 hypothetical protein [Candidatus Daviesbacteri
MTASALIADFLEYLEVECNGSQLTIRNYDHYLKRFLEFVGDTQPKDINPQLVRKYKQHLAKKNLKKVTQNYFLIALRSFLRYLKSQRIDSLSFEKVELGKQEASPTKVLDEKQLQQLLEAPDTTKKQGLRDRAILETLYSTGVKVSELVAFNIHAISSVWIEEYLLARKDSFRPLFIRFQGKQDPANEGEAMRLTPRSIQRIVEKYVKKLGFSIKATPHTLRYFKHSVKL